MYEDLRLSYTILAKAKFHVRIATDDSTPEAEPLQSDVQSTRGTTTRKSGVNSAPERHGSGMIPDLPVGRVTKAPFCVLGRWSSTSSC